MLTGIGIDVIEIRVVERLLRELGGKFLDVALRPSEIANLPPPAGRPMYIARVLAAKEAGMKALGLGLGPSTTWRSFEVDDRPGVLALRWLHHGSEGTRFHLALSRSADAVIATAWAFAEPNAGLPETGGGS